MPRNPELDLLHEQAQRAFEAKQAKFAELKIAREQTNAAYASLQLVRSEHDSAFAEMKRLREELDESSRNYDAVWGEYARLKESLSSRIDSLKAEANEEHRMMSECFDQASNEYEYGDRGLASSYSQDGHAHKANRDALNEEVSELCRELKAAREDAQWRAPKTDSSEYRAAKARFDQVKSRLDEARRVFDAARDRRDLLQAAFDNLNEEHKRLQAEFKRKLADAKAYQRAMAAQARQNNRAGRKSDPALESFPSSHKQWTHVRHGWIDDHPVTWCEGTGTNAGQVLICDGHVDQEYFDGFHNHYGPNAFPIHGDRIEDVLDALRRGRKYYSGPGK